MTIKTEQGYKVVSSRLESATVFFTGAVQYKLKQFVAPRRKCGPLCVFDNAHEASIFAKNEGGLVYHCEYVLSKKNVVWTNSWNLRSVLVLPCHTVLASKVKLLRKVKETRPWKLLGK